jgi:hypothetical protein
MSSLLLSSSAAAGLGYPAAMKQLLDHPCLPFSKKYIVIKNEREKSSCFRSELLLNEKMSLQHKFLFCKFAPSI